MSTLLPSRLLQKTRCYAQWKAGSVRDDGTPASWELHPKSEMEVQMGFFGGEFGEEWESLCGHAIRLLDPGEWNREAGPDFLGATMQVHCG